MDDKIKAVRKMQEYIEEHLYEEITLADLAKQSFFSPWYSYRLFKEYTSFTPADYIRRLRLSKSALRLRDEDCQIIDVAYDMGYKSVDGYQRAFRREFGCNPHEYVLNPIPLYLFTPYKIESKSYKREVYNSMENLRNIFIQKIHKPARKVIIKRGIKADEYFAYCNEVGCDVWGLLVSIKSISGEPVCLWLPDKYRKPGTSEYVQGVEVSLDYNGVIPEGFDVIEMPESEFLMFQGEPFEEEKYGQAIEEVRHSMEKFDPTIAGYKVKEHGLRIQLEPVGNRGYIEMIELE